MNLPSTISKTTLQGINTSGDTHAVRVVAHEVNNPSPYRLRCRNRCYLFEKDGSTGKHIIDIPVAAWMHGQGRRDMVAICDDFRTANGSAFTIQVVRIKPDTGTDDFAQSALDQIRKLLSGLGAPQAVVQAFACVDQRNLGALAEHVAQILNAPAGETAAQRQARRMREAKAKKKAELVTV